MYTYRCIKPRRVKRKKLGQLFYIIDKSEEFHFPILNMTVSNNKNRQMPNGIIFESFWLNYYGKLVKKETLIEYRKIHKTLLISKECDYTDPKFDAKRRNRLRR